MIGTEILGSKSRIHAGDSRSTMDFWDPHWNPSIINAIQGPTLETQDPYWNTRNHTRIRGSTLETQNPHWYTNILRSTPEI